MAILSILIVYALFLSAIVLSLLYFRRFRMPQPPLGVMNLWDVALTMIVIVFIPYLHLFLPRWANTAFLSLVTASLFYFLLEPVIGSRPIRLMVTLALVAAGVAATYLLPSNSLAFTAINDALAILTVIAISNVWVQSGVRARDVVILALAIAVYDFIFTGRLSVTADLFDQLDDLPFAPLIGWRVGDLSVSIGLGDTLMAASFVVALLKAYGVRAATLGFVAMAVSFPLLFVIPAPERIFLTAVFPAMVVIAPLQLLVYLYCRRYGAERTTREFRQVARKEEFERG